MLYRRNYLTYRLLDTFFRNWVLFALCIIGVCAVIVAALFARKPSYIAKVSIRSISATDVSEAIGFRSEDTPPAQRNVEHFRDLLQNSLPGGFVDQTLQDAKLDTPINPDPRARDMRLVAFRQGVFAAAESQDVFTIGLTWDNQPECERLVESLQKHYIDEAGQSRQATSIATTTILNSQIDDYNKRIEKAEKALIDYKSTHAGRLPDAQTAEITQLAQLKMERDYINITASTFEGRMKLLREQLAQVKPVSVLKQTVGSDPIMDQLRLLQAKRSGLIAQGYRATGMDVTGLDKQINSLLLQVKAAQAADPTSSRNVTETELQDNPEYQQISQMLKQGVLAQQQGQKQKEMLDKQIATYEADIQKLPGEERILTERTRDLELIRTQYDDLVKKREQAKLKATVDKITETSKLLVQNPVYAEPATNKTKQLMMLVGGLVVGTIIGLLAILAREWTDSSLRYGPDTARLLDVPVLACLPDNPQLTLASPQQKRLGGSKASAMRRIGSSRGAA